MMRYSLLYFEQDAAKSLVIRHEVTNAASNCDCFDRLKRSFYRDYITIHDIGSEIAPVLEQFASANGFGSNKARDFIAFEALSFTLRCVSANGYDGFNCIPDSGDQSLFLYKFIQRYALYLLELLFPMVRFSPECFVQIVADATAALTKGEKVQFSNGRRRAIDSDEKTAVESARASLKSHHISTIIDAVYTAVKLRTCTNGIHEDDLDSSWLNHASRQRRFLTRSAKHCSGNVVVSLSKFHLHA